MASALMPEQDIPVEAVNLYACSVEIVAPESMRYEPLTRIADLAQGTDDCVDTFRVACLDKQIGPVLRYYLSSPLQYFGFTTLGIQFDEVDSRQREARR